MLAAPVPEYDAARVAALHASQLLFTPDDVALDRVTAMARRHFQTPIALISLVDAQQQWFKSCIGLPTRSTPRDVSFCGHAILSPNITVIEDASLDGRFADNPLVTDAPHIRFYAGYPLYSESGFALGTLCVIDRMPRQWSAQDRQMLIDLGETAQTLLRCRQLGVAQRQLVHELQAAQRELLLDPFLRIWNKPAMLSLLAQRWAQAQQDGVAFALGVVDIDDFKQVNDCHGHVMGDEVLRQVCAALQTALRETGQVGRLGGDEFLLLLEMPQGFTLGRQALALGQALQCHGGIWHDNIELVVSYSVGLLEVNPAQLPAGLDAEALLARADAAMYQAKQRGKNQVFTAQLH